MDGIVNYYLSFYKSFLRRLENVSEERRPTLDAWQDELVKKKVLKINMPYPTTRNRLSSKTVDKVESN